ncbi:uncharacterized protein DUF4148 [Paraburkholderia sp. BL6669N2]|uniref:DUF4148 domain-containing protein n=1 Tax=Paraburkholderia sp. BL6669N2 TaxID=1938807 RepID=UPI000E245295|nr:DUF4148 domain-containing protein [Paraburkholderia sp. BL6669N2]REG52162.1 uncharacterized protein DUF4148 [Paraburkholderia sp. BL6669N2]
MNSQWKLASIIALLTISASASAMGKLSAAQCHSYPFAPVKGEVTHGDLMRELSELESVGYQPGGSDLNYPNNVTRAEKALHAKFIADCGAAMQASGPNSVGGAS